MMAAAFIAALILPGGVSLAQVVDVDERDTTTEGDTA